MSFRFSSSFVACRVWMSTWFLLPVVLHTHIHRCRFSLGASTFVTTRCFCWFFLFLFSAREKTGVGFFCLFIFILRAELNKKCGLKSHPVEQITILYVVFPGDNSCTKMFYCTSKERKQNKKLKCNEMIQKRKEKKNKKS